MKLLQLFCIHFFNVFVNSTLLWLFWNYIIVKVFTTQALHYEQIVCAYILIQSLIKPLITISLKNTSNK